MLFANFAEAMAEGRGKAQADALRLAKSETTAYKVTKSGIEEIASSLLRADDVVRVVAGQMIPGAVSYTHLDVYKRQIHGRHPLPCFALHPVSSLAAVCVRL